MEADKFQNKAEYSFAPTAFQIFFLEGALRGIEGSLQTSPLAYACNICLISFQSFLGHQVRLNTKITRNEHKNNYNTLLKYRIKNGG